MYNQLERRNCHFACRFHFKKYNNSILGKLNYFLHMVKASYALATSRLFIIDDFYFPIYVIKPRKGTDIVQLWHAAGAFKKFGLSTINKSFGPSEDYLRHVKIHSNYSKVYVSSKTVIPHYAEAFDMSKEKIYPLGVPRTDFFFNNDIKEEITKKFNVDFSQFKHKKLILYAPTFRGRSHYQEKFTSPIDISKFKAMLGHDYALIIHLHPYMRSGLYIEEKDKDFAFQVEGQFTIEELLILADVLITDYSSVIFDYSLLCRPIVFFSTDLEEYIKERDFYFDFLTCIPGPLFTEIESLAKWLKEGQYDMKLVSDFRNFFFDDLDGKASERIVNHMLMDNPSNINT
ncbi:CDP-ribitol ribitolphosphotransferase [Neobacillus drentensis]|nr:CDP-ribitol ribitolphosphotransferase [Neobacillus drentensis]